MENMIDRLADKIELLSEIISSLFMFAVTIILIVQVTLRYVFSTGLPWAEELARYLTIWACMLGASIMIKKGNLIRVDFLDKLWKPRIARMRNIAFNVFICFILSLLVYQGWSLAEHGKKSMCLSLPMSLFWAYLAIPVGAFLMLFYYLLNLYKEIVLVRKPIK